jgi:GT2 family glycosyltransferase
MTYKLIFKMRKYCYNISDMCNKKLSEGISFVIPAFNSETLLLENLPFLLEEIQAIKDKEIIVTDDLSTDSTLRVLKEKFPQVTVLSTKEKLGFSENCNKGVLAAKYNSVMCLNSDVRVTEGFLYPLIKLLEEENTFAVSPKILRPTEEKKNYINESLNKSFYCFGLFYHCRLREDRVLREESGSSITFACGAAVIFKKDMFVKLGGFDSLYYPFYWEDFDLSYRAWKRGWKTVYQPKSVVNHMHRGTIGRFYKVTDVDIIHERNRFLFVWKNITDSLLIMEHFLFLPAKLIEAVFQRRFYFLKSFLMATKKFKEAWKKREIEKREQKISDREVFGIYKEITKNFCKK